MELTYVWAWLAVWLAWVWAAIWQWILAKKAMEVMWKTPSLATFFLTVTILGIALVESVVIYWLVISFQLDHFAVSFILHSIYDKSFILHFAKSQTIVQFLISYVNRERYNKFIINLL